MGRSSGVSSIRPTIEMDYTFRSGKYKGKTVGEIVIAEPGYILFLHKNTEMDFDHLVIEAAEEQSQIWNP